jgi:hypothetical protein
MIALVLKYFSRSFFRRAISGENIDKLRQSYKTNSSHRMSSDGRGNPMHERSELLQRGARYDYVIANPPHHESVPSSYANAAFKGGPHNDFMKRLGADASEILSDGGSIMMILLSDVDLGSTCYPLTSRGFIAQTLLSRRHLFEQFLVLSFRKPL